VQAIGKSVMVCGPHNNLAETPVSLELTWRDPKGRLAAVKTLFKALVREVVVQRCAGRAGNRDRKRAAAKPRGLEHE
jgi:hypothetical protein